MYMIKRCMYNRVRRFKKNEEEEKIHFDDHLIALGQVTINSIFSELYISRRIRLQRLGTLNSSNFSKILKID